MTVSSQTQENVANATVAEQTVSDRLALKELVDAFSCLADTKEIDKQVMLFTDDATPHSFAVANEMANIVERGMASRPTPCQRAVLEKPSV